MKQVSRKLRTLVVLSLLLPVSGCGFLFGDEGVFRDRAEDYKKAPELPVIEVPEGKDSDALHEIYAIPEIQESVVLAGEFEVPRPTPLVVGEGEDVVRIQKLGDESWALVSVAPGQLWPQVRSFLSAAGIPVSRLDARAGVMETNWLELENKPLKSRFRFRIERGVQRGSSELHVLQMNQVGDGSTWPTSSDDIEQEAEMLRSVSQYVANSADTAPVSMIADQAISASGKVALREASAGYTYVELELPFNRAWASVSRALQRSGFEITDRDRSAGRFYARFTGPQEEEEEGWFDWLFGGGDEHPLAGQDFIISIDSQGEEMVHVRLWLADETATLAKRDEQSLLTLIKGNIS